MNASQANLIFATTNHGFPLEFVDRENHNTICAAVFDRADLTQGPHAGKRFVSDRWRDYQDNLIKLECVGEDETHLKTNSQGSFAKWICLVERM